MQHIAGIRREDLSKTGEKRVALTPAQVEQLVAEGYSFLVQPGKHPTSGENKRAFSDLEYVKAGARISEDLGEATVIFGLKEIEVDRIEKGKTYLLFSHTHKGQHKNRKMLRRFVEQQATVIDYELMTKGNQERIITAFTYFAGYAGIIDTLWVLGRRLTREGIPSQFDWVPQSIEKEDLSAIKAILHDVAANIATYGTPVELPPVIIGIMGNGKTATGVQEILADLDVKRITPADLEEVFTSGSRKTVYQVVFDIPDMFRLRTGANIDATDPEDLISAYFSDPGLFESNMDQYLPYLTVLMNCTVWAPRFPRTVTREMVRKNYSSRLPLKVIGDISCDPNGSVEFSRETWIDEPVFTWDPASDNQVFGVKPLGVPVMAVTNLPCEFSADASGLFATELMAVVRPILNTNFDVPFEEADLPDAVSRATILWNGKFTPPYAYMQAYLTEQVGI